MTIAIAVALILGLATLLGWLRLGLWHRAAHATGQASPGRTAALALLQPVCAGLLYLALFSPLAVGGSSSLRIATAGTARLTGAQSGAPLILLPEAPNIGGGEAVPDLATALRRHPGVTMIKVLGDGLTPRDLDAARKLAIAFEAPPLRPGIMDIARPASVAPGGRFVVGATLNGWSGATVDLLDPAGRVTDSGTADKDGHVQLAGTARAAGAVLFSLRARSGRQVVAQADVPVWIAESARPRLLILAGAPGPEVKYLRRWAIDAGYDVTTQMRAGGGIALGDAPVSLDAGSLRRFDVAIVDERSWPAARGSLLAAVRGGMGLVLRAGGAMDGATRSQWQALGFSLSGPGGIAPLALPKAPDPAIARTRHGIGSVDAPVDMALPEELVPDISRIGLAPGGDNGVPLLQDAGGTSLAAWRAVGAGRVALFTAIDSYGLTLTGRGDLYGDWWSRLLGTVARPAPGSVMVTDTVWAGERMTLCGLTGEGRVEGPDGGVARMLPVAGCGAFWPAKPGWRSVRTQGEVRPFYVQPQDALPVMRAARDQRAMAMLRREAPTGSGTMTPAAPRADWPWWLAWLATSALLWWLERSRVGRPAPPPPTQSAM
ncbi:hypothetical protein ASE85_08945 [Sphingobium sp. Leaf26]|uniref:hypothetical protein n=1 Tax=Sphingobium sp. Leaf26 TaxID=1735693 RepID=UPI0006F4603F|nr:hypothetical protein [Sphingobium sp. Leaf26]KQN00754.1 hypothetical protein ASE85_08945 [Sphingobium sp. Leaf26]